MFRRGALLGFTFLLNIGSAMNKPAWQAIVPELVPQAMILETVSLNGEQQSCACSGAGLGGLMVAGVSASTHGGRESVCAFVRGRDLDSGELEAGAAVQVGAAIGAGCGIDTVGVAVCEIRAGPAGTAGAGVYFFVFYLGDMIAAGAAACDRYGAYRWTGADFGGVPHSQ
jgi:hypothetical protein